MKKTTRPMEADGPIDGGAGIVAINGNDPRAISAALVHITADISRRHGYDVAEGTAMLLMGAIMIWRSRIEVERRDDPEAFCAIVREMFVLSIQEGLGDIPPGGGASHAKH